MSLGDARAYGGSSSHRATPGLMVAHRATPGLTMHLSVDLIANLVLEAIIITSRVRGGPRLGPGGVGPWPRWGGVGP